MTRLQTLCLVVLSALLMYATTAPIPAAAQAPTATQLNTIAPTQRVTHYTLPPEKLQKAYDLYIIGAVLFFAGTLYGLLLMVIFLWRRWTVTFRDWAERATANRFLQAAIVAPLFAATLTVLMLPLVLYGHHVSRSYGISVQGWGSWFRDWAVQLTLTMGLSIVLGWILYAVIRKSPRRWWLYFWLAFVPISAFLVFLSPITIEPLFNKFEPLQPKNPELVAQLERVVTRAGMQIPPSRMYEMKASEKLTGSNAYVTGFGATKRVVVWDTAIQKLTTQQITYVFGHELGHYVLGHVVKGFVVAMAVFLVLFYLSYRLATWMHRRWGARWGIRGLDDWASVPLLWLAISMIFFVSGPLLNAYSRHLEHQADQYGLEVVHGMFPDSSQVAAQSFQLLGEEWLEYPHLSPAAVLFLWDHPPITDRVQFALTYDPWIKGASPQFVKNPPTD